MRCPEIATRVKLLKTNNQGQKNRPRASRALSVPLPAFLPFCPVGCSFDAVICRILQNLAKIVELCMILPQTAVRVPPSPKVEPWNKGFQNRLAALGEKKPERKAAQIRALWPEINVAR
jgi:hypothetical protein